MKQLLSLKRINENSSYPVETTGEDGFYQFFTDGGVHYSVGFMEDDILYNPQNEMFRLLGTKRSFSQNETFFFSHP